MSAHVPSHTCPRSVGRERFDILVLTLLLGPGVASGHLGSRDSSRKRRRQTERKHRPTYGTRQTSETYRISYTTFGLEKVLTLTQNRRNDIDQKRKGQYSGQDSLKNASFQGPWLGRDTPNIQIEGSSTHLFFRFRQQHLKPRFARALGHSMKHIQ